MSIKLFAIHAILLLSQNIVFSKAERQDASSPNVKIYEPANTCANEDDEGCLQNTDNGGAVVEDDQDWELCRDQEDKCGHWAQRGECENYPNYMLKFCRKSCGVCKGEDVDVDPGVEQIVEGTEDEKDKTLEVVRLSQRYLKNDVLTDERLSSVVSKCRNDHELCAFWASLGECSGNVAYMQGSCSLACRVCDKHLVE